MGEVAETWADKQRMLDAIQEVEDDPTSELDDTPLEHDWPDFHVGATSYGGSLTLTESVSGHVHGDVATVHMQLEEPVGVKPGDVWVERDEEGYV